MAPAKDDATKTPFPAWLTQLAYFGGIIVALTMFSLKQSGDIRSTREEVARVSSDIQDIRQSLPNREASEIRMKVIEDKLDKLRADLDFEAAKAQRQRELLIKKGYTE